jgi:hypothetical protein
LSLLHTLLARIVKAPVVREAKLPDGSRPDILIGVDADEPSRWSAVIEGKKRPGFRGDRWLREGLDRLDHYLDASSATHGALVVFGATPLPKTDARLEYVKTPSGRDVLLLHL